MYPKKDSLLFKLGIYVQKKACRCGSVKVKKHGKQLGIQRYRCLKCGGTFSSKRKPRTDWIQKAYEDYTDHKQSYKELTGKYGKSGKTLRKLFDKFAGATGEVFECSEPFVLILDATFFGRNYGILMARNLNKVLYWQEIVSESVHEYEQCLKQLEATGYRFSAFVIDGRQGVKQFLMRRYPDIPIQLCQFHQIQIVKRYIPMRAKTEAARRLRRIALGLTKTYETALHSALKSASSGFGSGNKTVV